VALLLGIPHPFWFRHRHDELVARWAAEVGVDRVSVVIGDDRDHRILLRAFEGLLGLNDSTLLPVEGKSNPSLTAEEIAIVLRVQQILKQRRLRFAERVRSRQIQRRLLTLRERRPTDSKIVIPYWAVERVRAISREIHDGLLASGVRIIGDPELLLRADSPRADSPQLDRDEIERTAQAMIAELEADGKLQVGQEKTSTTRAFGKALRRLTRLVRG